VASNFFFSYRAVLAKKLYLVFPSRLDEVALFSRIASTGLLLLLPLTAAWEGRDICSRLLLLWPAAGEAHDLVPSSTNTNTGSSTGSSGEGAGGLLLLLLFNGAAYFSYNVLSFLVLRRTDVIVHAILNVCRRMAIIVFTAHYFSVHISLLNAAGVVLALCGVLLFSTRK
jgi:hypothetical protein